MRLVTLTLAAVALAGCAASPPVRNITRDAKFDQLRDAFNRGKDDVRVVALLSPT